MDTSDPIFWAVAVISASLVGLSKGGLNLVGMLGVPVLALVINPITAAGLLLPVFVASDVFGVWAYRREFNLRVLMILVPAGAVGTAIGWATASIVSEQMVTAVIGMIGFVFALNILLKKQDTGQARKPKVLPGLFWGTVSGFTSFVSHAGSPPFQVYVLPLNLTKTVFAGTTTIFFAIENAMKIIPYWHLGQLSPANMSVAAILFIPASISVFVGVRLVRVLSPQQYFGFVAWALLAVSIKLLWDAFF